MSNQIKIASLSTLGVTLALLLSTQALAQPEISGMARTSFGQFGVSTKVGSDKAESSSGFAGSFLGGLIIEGTAGAVGYSFGLIGEAKNGGTEYGGTYERDDTVGVSGELTFSPIESLTIALGNSVGVGEGNITNVSVGGYPIGINRPSDFGFSAGSQLVFRFDDGTFQAGFGFGGDKSDELVVIEKASADDASTPDVDETVAVVKEGSLNETLYFANGKLLDGALFVGLRGNMVTETATDEEVATKLTNKTTSSALGFGAKFTQDLFSVGFESGTTSGTLKIGDKEKLDTFNTSIIALGGSVNVGTGVIAIGYSADTTSLAKAPKGEGAKKGEKTDVVTLVEYKLNPNINFVFGSQAVTDDLVADTSLDTYGATKDVVVAGVTTSLKSTETQSFIGLVLKATF